MINKPFGYRCHSATGVTVPSAGRFDRCYLPLTARRASWAVVHVEWHRFNARMGVLRKLVDGLRGSAGPTANAVQRVQSLYGSAYAPSPAELPVPEELRRAVAEEEFREARERTAAERSGQLWGVSPRLARRIARDFPDAETATTVARLVVEAANWERVQAAIVMPARGDLRLVREGAELATIDWRDVLVNGGLANDDWPDILDTELGPS